jgi:hypothetical protein
VLKKQRLGGRFEERCPTELFEFFDLRCCSQGREVPDPARDQFSVQDHSHDSIFQAHVLLIEDVLIKMHPLPCGFVSLVLQTCLFSWQFSLLKYVARPNPDVGIWVFYYAR